MMRRPSASGLISFSNSPRFSAPIRPHSLMTTSPFAALVIFSIHPLLRILIPVTPFTHACNGNHSAKRKLLKLRQLKESKIDEVSQLARAVQNPHEAVESHVRKRASRGLAVLRGIYNSEATLVNLQRSDFRLQSGSWDTEPGRRTGRSVNPSSAFAQGSLNDFFRFGSRLSS